MYNEIVYIYISIYIVLIYNIKKNEYLIIKTILIKNTFIIQNDLFINKI